MQIRHSGFARRHIEGFSTIFGLSIVRCGSDSIADYPGMVQGSSEVQRIYVPYTRRTTIPLPELRLMITQTTRYCVRFVPASLTSWRIPSQLYKRKVHQPTTMLKGNASCTDHNWFKGMITHFPACHYLAFQITKSLKSFFSSLFSSACQENSICMYTECHDR